MRIIEQLVYKITGDNKEFDKSLDTSEKATNKFGSVANKIFAGITVTAIAMSVKKLGELAIASATALDRVDKMSQKIGISRQAFQEWDFILSQSGASVDGLQMGIKTLSNAADEARKGTALYAESFDRLGVSVTDVNGNMKDQETLFNEVFKALANVDNQTERTAIANKLLGRSATELAPAFNAGGDAIEAMRTKAHDLGLVLGDELVDQGVVLTDNIDQLKRAFGAWRIEALAPIIGVLVSITDKILTQKTATSEMAGVVDIIKTKTAQYQDISEKLLATQNDLSDAERNLLLARKETLAFEIQKQLASLASIYNETKDNISELEEQVGSLNKLFDNQSAYLKTLTPGTIEYQNAQQGLERIYGTLVGKQQELSSAQISYNSLIGEASKLVADGILDIERLADVNSELYNRIIAGADAYKREAEQRKKANAEFATWNEYTKAQLIDAQRSIELNEKNAYSIELLRLVNSRLNDILADEAKATEDLAEKEKARNEILENTNKALANSEEHNKALGEEYDLNSSKIGILEDAIKSLIDSGLTVADSRVAQLVNQLTLLREETAKTSEVISNTSFVPDAQKAFDAWVTARNKSIQDSFNEETKARAQAYAEIEKSRMSDHEKEMLAIRTQAQAFLEAGVDRVDVATWQSEQIQKLLDRENELREQKAEEEKKRQEELTAKLESELEARNKAILDSFNEQTSIRAEAYELLESFYQSDNEKAITSIQKQAGAFLQAGVNRVDVAKWQSEQIQNLMQSDADKAEEEAERARKAWEDYSFGVAGSIASMWQSINQARENANAQELQDLEELHDTRIQDAKDAGATEEELAKLQQTLADELNAKKTELAREDLERQKKVAIFSVVLDTARAIMQIWSDATAGGVIGKSIWTGIAAGAGVAQLAAINSQPMPSFDVGSIRIPETTQAIVHKDEMILTAPQAEQARREGITISPNGGGGGNYTFMIYLDGRQISDATVKNINSGMYKIDARVVK